MGGYITYAGDLDRGRLEQLLARVGALELEVLEERAAVRLARVQHFWQDLASTGGGPPVRLSLLHVKQLLDVNATAGGRADSPFPRHIRGRRWGWNVQWVDG